ncbi:LacI family DNA-binding transcriptional regulator [Coraliomargarita sp. SDUM461004]|uniref:LacI family DNA-binding transcriptional regulator n=1 Tax=Thalassobacterium sedimentorum TaxID=3041258 RepID=A0ABU1AGQ8_9BACT|nr:LacI family DNA-binding transcriptional regulator [Coraliomargarita sp. SDUM461004]MDQ8193919.1 LacI family DNA-binding transcriptional regulator [Coraliomargarita sp. SDUM461004]
MNPHISLQKIANELGVSKMTVSLALRKHPKIPEATRIKIAEKAKEMGYLPNPDVSKLMTAIRQRNTNDPGLPLAYLTTGNQRDDWKQSATELKYWEGAKEQAKAYGYYIETFWLSEPGMTEQRMSKILWNRGIQGIILHPFSGALTRTCKHQPLEMMWERFITVAMSDTLMNPILNRVIHDHYTSILLAMKSLTEKGYSRIGLCMTEDMDLRVNQRWQAGFRVYRANHPIARIAPLISNQLNARSIKQWVQEKKLDAIIGASYRMPHYLNAIGMQIGADIAYADLDLNIQSSEYANISGIEQNSKMLGIAAVDLLMSGIHRNERGIPEIPLTIQVEGSWQDRGSTPTVK